MSNIKTADYMEVAEKLYKYANPNTKMDTPNTAYTITEEWYIEWLQIETKLDLYEWCIRMVKEK